MVHNGIEYGDMQLIAEAYDLLHRGLGTKAPELHRIFAEWNETELKSYLIQITADIFRVKDESGSGPLVEMILDSAGQKGTGRWTVQTALEMGVAVPTITAAVEARIISSRRELRQRASRVLPGPEAEAGSGREVEADLKEALYGAKICSYAQGFDLLRTADQAHDFGLDLAAPAKVWRAGCIIRSVFLDDVHRALKAEPELGNLVLAPFFSRAMEKSQAALRRIVAKAVGMGIAVPGLAASLAYYDSLRSARLPANLIQAQRDYFGAHTYQRLDREGTFHTPWLEELEKG
jgi:6-phosphogluconate dehydrogenase